MKHISILMLAALLGCQQSVSQPEVTGSDNDNGNGNGNGNGTETANQTESRSDKNDQAPPTAMPSGEVKIWLTGDLPKCDKEKNGSVLYVVTESAFKHCTETTWKTIDLRGPRGDLGAAGSAGPQGLQGLQGPQGAAGATGPLGQAGMTGASGLQGPAGPQGIRGQDGLDGDRYVGRTLHTSDGAVVGTVVDDFDYNTTGFDGTSWGGKPLWDSTSNSRLFIVKSPSNKFYGYFSSSPKVDILAKNSNGSSLNTLTQIRSRDFEKKSLTKIGLTYSVLFYTNSSCSGSGYVGYSMTQAWVSNSGARLYSNQAIIDGFAALGYPLTYSWMNGSDIDLNCSASEYRTDIKAYGDGATSCSFVERSHLSGQNATGQVCPYSTSSAEVPSTISAGWYVTK